MTSVMTFQPQEETCVACSGKNIAHEITRDEMSFDKCRDCGFVFMNPMMDEESIAAFYRHYARTESYKRRADKKMKRARSRMKRLKKIVKGGRFLDVGCNAGFVVEAAREAGFEACGFDPSEEAIRYAREMFPKNSFACITIDQVTEALGQFDLIYCSEVIEHVLDPDGFVEGLSQCLKPGGVLYLTTPDGGHWNKPKELGKWEGFCPPEHCLYFTLDAMKAFLSRHGLQIEKRFFAFKPGLKILASRTG